MFGLTDHAHIHVAAMMPNSAREHGRNSHEPRRDIFVVAEVTAGFSVSQQSAIQN